MLKKCMAAVLTISMLFIYMTFAAGNTYAANEPLKLHPNNGRYFMFRGQRTVLIGSSEHYGAVINAGFNYITYLNEIQNKNLNVVRVFTGPYVEVDGEFNIAQNTLGPASGNLLFPWARSSTPGYALGGNKFDLNTWNTAYWDRLTSIVQAASDRGIVVEINLFCTYYNSNSWARSPFNPSNNINGYGTCGMVNALTMNRGNLATVQDAYVTKIVQTLNGFDNIYYEICNEPYLLGTVSMDWQQYMATLIKNTENPLPYKHLISLNWNNGGGNIVTDYPNISIYNFHYCSPPNAPGFNYSLNKVIGCNENGASGTGDDPYRLEGWNFILAGGALYNNLDFSFTTTDPNGTYTPGSSTPGGGSPSLRTSYKALINFMNSFDFISMSPNNSVIAGGIPSGATARALVEIGKQYAVYIAGGSSASLQMNLPAGTYTAEWVNTKTGNVDKSENITNWGGGNKTLVSPSYTTDIALRIKLTGSQTTPTESFVKGINCNGAAVTIEGNAWLSEAAAEAAGFSINGASAYSGARTWNPAPANQDAQNMLDSVVYKSGGNLDLSQTIANGSYKVYIWMAENCSDNYRKSDLKLEGNTVASGIGEMANNTWRKYGPYTVTVSDGTLNIQFARIKGDPQVSGITIYNLTADSTFIKGINCNGNAVTIEGNAWLSESVAEAAGFSINGASTYSGTRTWSPAPANQDAQNMLDSVIYKSGGNLDLSQTITNGSYKVYIWMTENCSDNYRKSDLKLEGTIVASGIGEMANNTWKKYGPYTVTVSDGTLNIQLARIKGDPQISGIAIFSAS